LGRGALDDKSGVIGLMEAATYLIKNNFQLREPLILALVMTRKSGEVALL